MSTKKTKRNKSGRVRLEKKVQNINVQEGEGYYGTVEKRIGGNRIMVKLNNGVSHEAIIPGRFRNRNWLNVGSTVLLNLDYEVVEIIKNNNYKLAEAEKMLDQLYNESDEESENEENNGDNPDNEIKKAVGGSYVKTKTMLDRKEKVKEREMSRRTGKVFSKAEDLEKEISDIMLGSNKKIADSNGNDSGSDNENSEEINIDDI